MNANNEWFDIKQIESDHQLGCEVGATMDDKIFYLSHTLNIEYQLSEFILEFPLIRIDI